MFGAPFLRTSQPDVLLAGAALIFAACTSAASPTPGATPTAQAATYTVNAATGSVGSYLTGEGTKTLYVKQGDKADATTTCTGSCIASWPPFTLDTGEQVAAGSGVSGTLASFTRPEGTTQVTYNGKPLYYFSGDSAVGDTKGQGVGGVWSVAAP